MVILYHCNFSLGAFNSNIALFSFLSVAASGIVGKHIYTKITRALNGERINLISLQQAFETVRKETYVHFVFVPGVREELNGFAAKVITPTKILMVSIGRVFEVGHQAIVARHKIRALIDAYLDEHARKRHWSQRRKYRMLAQMLRKSRQFFDQAVKVADFNFYERVFSLWHIIHLPLTFIFITTLLLHIFSVTAIKNTKFFALK